MVTEDSDFPVQTDRADLVRKLVSGQRFDIIVVGGGATGLGVALDASLRGFSVALLEAADFAQGTSSRATKLAHGGVRYLAQGDFSLVSEALHERSAMLHNASHLASPLPFIVPLYKIWEAPFYGAGLKLYDALAGRMGLGTTAFLGRRQTLDAAPGLVSDHLKGGIRYWDAQFDDARYALALARTAVHQGAQVLNYCPVTGLSYRDGKVSGVSFRDAETGKEYQLEAACVINACGVWADDLREKDALATDGAVRPVLSPSQGIHLAVDRHFFPSDHALLIPRTTDGRVLFAVPWLGSVILGTTDTPVAGISYEPRALKDEVDFILSEIACYLTRPPTRDDIKSVWAGLRPLVRVHDNSSTDTSHISREHSVLFSQSGLVSVIGGKWTTYRAMAEDVLTRCAQRSLLGSGPLPAGGTVRHRLIGAGQQRAPDSALAVQRNTLAYGSEWHVLKRLEGFSCQLAPGLNEAMVRFAARYEYARQTADVLARRSRLLFLDAAAAGAVAARIADILFEETGVDPQLEAFLQLAEQYAHVP